MVRGGQIINIAGTSPVDDPEYRYKMPAVYGKIEGSGNGIKTAIPNITDVANALYRTPGEVNKFFGTELGAQCRYNADTDRAIVNGAHTDAVLQDLMHRYVEKFVLCPSCRLPETKYKIKSDSIWHVCAACGAKELVDMSHKLCNYILAENKKAKKEKGKDKDKDKKEKKKKNKKDAKDSDEEKKKAKKEKKKKKDKKKDKKEKSSGTYRDVDSNSWLTFVIDGEDDEKDDNGEEGLNGASDDFGSDDGSEEPEAGVDDAGALKLAVDAVKAFILESEEFSDADLVNLVGNQQRASALKSHDKVRIIVQGAFTEDFFKKKEVELFSPAISSITNSNRIMERHLIGALEEHWAEKPKNFAVMLKQLYDEDALQEESILEWADQGRTEYTLSTVDEDDRAALRGEAEPVVVWLQEAESEDESDSE